MRIAAIESTGRFVGSAARPRQVVRVTVTATDPVPGRIRVSLHGPAVRTPEPALVPGLEAGGTLTTEVGVTLSEPVTEGARRRVTVVAEADGARCTAEREITAAVTGWTMWMVSHFHYDPVWWNTQGGLHRELVRPARRRAAPPARRQDRLRPGPRAPGRRTPRRGLQVRPRRGRLPQAVLGPLPRGPRRPAAFPRRGPHRDRRRQLQRGQHQPHPPRVRRSATPSTASATSATSPAATPARPG